MLFDDKRYIYRMALVPWPMDITEFLERHELYCVLAVSYTHLTLPTIYSV